MNWKFPGNVKSHMKKLIEKLIAKPLHAILSTALEMTGSKWIEMTR
jgi:hypothetical protein